MNKLNTNRRGFLQVAGAGTVASLASLQASSIQRTRADETKPAEQAAKFTLAMASYTLRKFDLDQTLAMTKRVGLKAICFKSFHLPLDSTKEQIAEVVKKVNDAGLTLYGGGVIGMKNAEQIDQAFEYAKAAGLIRIIASPTPEMLPTIEQKVKEHDIQVCIHNHGPGDTHFPTPVIAYKHIKDLDRRIGICHDIGHTTRYGSDAIAETEQCADRIYDFHIKDVTEATKSGHATPFGRGVIDLPKFFRTLVKIGYAGYAAFEYEAEASDPLVGVAESVGYARGMIDMM